jgi:hypothetical protein
MKQDTNELGFYKGVDEYGAPNNLCKQIYLLVLSFLSQHGHQSVAENLYTECLHQNLLPTGTNWLGEACAPIYKVITAYTSIMPN